MTKTYTGWNGTKLEIEAEFDSFSKGGNGTPDAGGGLLGWEFKSSNEEIAAFMEENDVSRASLERQIEEWLE